MFNKETGMLSDEDHARIECDNAVLSAARAATFQGGQLSRRDLRGKESAAAAEGRLSFGAPGSPGRPLARYHRALDRQFGSADLSLLRRKYPNAPVVRRALKATYELHKVSPRDVQGYERFLTAEAQVGHAVSGPLAHHAKALRELFGTAHLYEAGMVAVCRSFG